MLSKPTANTWSESNSASLHQTQGASDPALIRAHDMLDREVDRAFGAPRKPTTEEQRQEILFKAYAHMTR